MSAPNPHASRIEAEAAASLARLAVATGHDLHGTSSEPLRTQQTRDRAAPEPLPDPLPPVPTLDAALLPEPVRAWCKSLATGLQVPLEFVGVPVMVTLGAAIGRSAAVSMKQHGGWLEFPFLWGGVVGRPSSGKSPAIAPAMRMLDAMMGEELNAYAEAVKTYAADEMLRDAETATAKKQLRGLMSNGKRDDAAAIVNRLLQTAAANDPNRPRLVVNDATVEKLGELLNENPRGLIQCRDELSGWLASMDRQGREGDRGFWLECWNANGRYTFDRIGRGTVAIECCAMSIIGGIQPGKLAEYVRGAVHGGSGDDGLLQRFQLLVYPDIPSNWRYVDAPADRMLEARALETYKRLRYGDPQDCGARTSAHCPAPVFEFSSEARELRTEWHEQLMGRLRGGDESPWMESHLAKYPAMVGRLSLVLHLANDQHGDISAETVADALDWAAFLEAHARRIYAPATHGGLASAHAILKKRDELVDGFTARDISRKCWSGLTDAKDIADGLEILTDYGHLSPSRPDTGGRPTTEYQWREAP